MAGQRFVVENRSGAGGAVGQAAIAQAPPDGYTEGNGCAERFIRTLKENLSWVRSSDAAEELRAALLDFRETCNSTWLIERHGFRPPDAVRIDQPQRAALAA